MSYFEPFFAVFEYSNFNFYSGFRRPTVYFKRALIRDLKAGCCMLSGVDVRDVWRDWRQRALWLVMP